jgi:hypothetical protein
VTWSIPMTAVAGNVFSAAQFNQYVRDNLNETAPAKASALNQWIVSAGANAVVARQISALSIATSESTSSTSFTDLATPGPAIAATTGTAAFVTMASSIANTGSGFDLVAVAVSGATTVAAVEANSIGLAPGTTGARLAGGVLLTGLNAGTNTFTLKYRVSASSGSFLDRRIGVFPL